MVRVIAASLDARDPYTLGHSTRVARMSCALGRRLGMGEESFPTWSGRRSSTTSGRSRPPTTSSSRGAPVTRRGRADEKPSRRRHGDPPDGAVPPPVHPRGAPTTSGTTGGVPGRNQGDEIPLHARLIALADAFDAMTTDRPYRQALSEEAAITEILRFRGTQFSQAGGRFREDGAGDAADGRNHIEEHGALRRKTLPPILLLSALTATAFSGCAGLSKTSPRLRPRSRTPSRPPRSRTPLRPPRSRPRSPCPRRCSPRGWRRCRRAGTNGPSNSSPAPGREKPGHAGVAREFDGALLALKKNGDAAYAQGKWEDAGKRWMGTLRFITHPAANWRDYPFTRSEVRAKVDHLSAALTEKALTEYRRGGSVGDRRLEDDPFLRPRARGGGPLAPDRLEATRDAEEDAAGKVGPAPAAPPQEGGAVR